jgi:hypothetical protein
MKLAYSPLVILCFFAFSLEMNAQTQRLQTPSSAAVAGVDTNKREIIVKCRPSALQVNSGNTVVFITSDSLRSVLQQFQVSDANVEPAYYGLVGGRQETTMTGDTYFTPDYSNIIRIIIPSGVNINAFVLALRALPMVYAAGTPIQPVLMKQPK